MTNLLKTVRFGARSRRALSIAAGAASAVGIVLISSSAGFSQDGGGLVKTGMPLSAGRTMPPVIHKGRHGERLVYTFVVTQNGSKILVSLNKKPLINVEKNGDGYRLSDPNGSGEPILTLPAPTH